MIRRLRLHFAAFLNNRSVVRSIRYPSRRNSIFASLYLLFALPLTSLLIPVFMVMRLLGRPQKVFVVKKTDGEFGHLLDCLERVRGSTVHAHRVWVVVVDHKKHQGFDNLYRQQCGWMLLWPGFVSRIVSQAIVMQPRFALRLNVVERFATEHPLPMKALASPTSLVETRSALGKNLNFCCSSYVAMAVFTRKYEEESNPGYSWKTTSLESVGNELLPSVDYLTESRFDLVLLGSRDTGVSYIARPIPRLSDFAPLGTDYEVALGSGCEYFWTDGVGAWWTSAPFKRPVLISNCSRMYCEATSLPPGIQWLVLPTRYQTKDGHQLTLRQMLQEPNLNKHVARGNVELIRNKPNEIVEAHQEMIGRVRGSHITNPASDELNQRLKSIYSEFRGCIPFSIPQQFLFRYQYLLA